MDLDNCATRLRVLRRFVRALLAAARPVDVALAACHPLVCPAYWQVLAGLPLAFLPVGPERHAVEQALIAAATGFATRGPVRFTVASEDGVFAAPAAHGPVRVLTRRPGQVSRALRDVAVQVGYVPHPRHRRGSKPRPGLVCGGSGAPPSPAAGADATWA